MDLSNLHLEANTVQRPHLLIHLSYISLNSFTFLHTYLHTYTLTHLHTAYVPTYLPTYLRIYVYT